MQEPSDDLLLSITLIWAFLKSMHIVIQWNFHKYIKSQVIHLNLKSKIQHHWPNSYQKSLHHRKQLDQHCPSTICKNLCHLNVCRKIKLMWHRSINFLAQKYSFSIDGNGTSLKHVSMLHNNYFCIVFWEFFSFKINWNWNYKK